VGAYVIWGLFPLYWKEVRHVPAPQLLGHRILWSCLILVGILLFTKQWRTFRAAALSPSMVRIYSAAAFLIGFNWLVYVWAVNSGFIIEASLGYFINPLLSVLLGVIFLRERLRPWQWVPVGLAAIGVLYLTFSYGRLPWIALTLAFSFGLYGLVKKAAPLGSLYGLTLETGLLFLPALIYLVYSGQVGQGAFLHTGAGSDLLLVGAGLMTTVPLLMFSSAVRRIPLSLAGILQYITPTLQFLCGVLIYREPFTSAQLIGFGIVWGALIIFVMEGFLALRRSLVRDPDNHLFRGWNR
jgi:chloramphenicol-sensitive protein RarD